VEIHLAGIGGLKIYKVFQHDLKKKKEMRSQDYVEMRSQTILYQNFFTYLLEVSSFSCNARKGMSLYSNN
jgi:hypothetical protein